MDTPKKPSERLVEGLLGSLPLPDFFGPETLARHLNQPVAWVQAGIASGEIPARRVRGFWIISKAALNGRLASPDSGRSGETRS